MFYLRDLPDDTTLKEFAERYDNMDISAVKACLVLLRIGSDVLTGFDVMLARHGLSQGRFLTLIVLYRTPETPLSPSALAELVGVTRATMTGLLDGLEQEHLLERVADPTDRRRLLIRITTDGIRVLQQMLPDYYDRIGKLMTPLAPHEREQLVTLLYHVQTGIPALLSPSNDKSTP
jgi:DNA-binding MarR family transcriptional regulator